MAELKKIELAAGASFVANGTTYTVTDSLSFAEHTYFNALCVRLAYGRDYDSISQNIAGAIADINKMQMVPACVKLDNLQKGITAFPNRAEDAFAVCSLFIKYAGEDRGPIDAAAMGAAINKKIADWTAEGLDAVPFLHLAARQCGNLLNDWKEMEGLKEGREENEPES
jgi:hypothetical protein